MSEQQIKGLLERLLQGLRDCDGEDHPALQELGPAASREQLAALERHWGRRLPPSYREVLERHDGIGRLWFDVRLLSIQDIIKGAPEVRAVERSPADLSRWSFARGPEPGDVLAFDPSRAPNGSELPVVQLTEWGEHRRWPSFGDLLQELYEKLPAPRGLGAREPGLITCHLWTNLWSARSNGSAVHSRGIVWGRGESHADQKELFGRAVAAEPNPLLTAAQHRQVSLRFEQAVEAIAHTKRGLAIALTDGPSGEAGSFYYVYYEPCADLVIALSLLEKYTTIHADGQLWDTLGPRFEAVIAQTGELLQQARIVDALLLSIGEACGWLSSPH